MTVFTDSFLSVWFRSNSPAPFRNLWQRDIVPERTEEPVIHLSVTEVTNFNFRGLLLVFVAWETAQVLHRTTEAQFRGGPN